MPGVAEALEAGTAGGIVCITMGPCGLMICCPGADTICRMLPKSHDTHAINIGVPSQNLQGLLRPTWPLK